MPGPWPPPDEQSEAGSLLADLVRTRPDQDGLGVDEELVRAGVDLPPRDALADRGDAARAYASTVDRGHRYAVSGTGSLPSRTATSVTTTSQSPRLWSVAKARYTTRWAGVLRMPQGVAPFDSSRIATAEVPSGEGRGNTLSFGPVAEARLRTSELVPGWTEMSVVNGPKTNTGGVITPRR